MLQTRHDRIPAGLIAILAALTIFFAALSSAYIVRRGITADWTPLLIPGLVWLSPMLLLCGSVLVEMARRKPVQSKPLLLSAALSGLVFVVLLVLAAKDTAPVSSSSAAAFFKVVIAAFLPAVAAAIVITLRKRVTISGVLYWHYLNVLWIWLLLLFAIWR